MKKTKGKGKARTRKPAKPSAKKRAKAPVAGRAPRAVKPVDLVRVRENVSNLVGGSAEEIVAKVIEVARTTGQLASAKYLFEAAGLYPASEQTAGEAKEDSLAQILLRRLGLPVRSEGERDTISAGLAGDEKSARGQGIPMAGDEDVAGLRGHGQEGILREIVEKQ